MVWQQDTTELTPRSLFDILCDHRGLENAIAVSRICGIFDCRDRQIREMIPEVERIFGVAVLQSYDSKNGGLYLPRDREELIEGLRPMRSHALSEIQHVNSKVEAGERMFGTEIQLRLC